MQTIPIINKITRGNQEGFLIVEGLIAMAIFGIAMIAVVALLAGAMRTNASARQVTQASALAATRLEELMSLSPRAPLLGGSAMAGYNGTASDEVIGGQRYTLSYQVQRDLLLTNTLNVAMTVSWSDAAFGDATTAIEGQRTVTMNYNLTIIN